MPGRTGIVQRVQEMVLPPDAFPFDHHAFARDELLGLPLGREVLGQREVLGRIGLEQRHGARLLQRS